MALYLLKSSYPQCSSLLRQQVLHSFPLQVQASGHLVRIEVGGDETVNITCRHSFLSASASEFHVTLETRVVGNKCVSPSTVFKYAFEVLYLSVSFSCYFPLSLHYISYEVQTGRI